MGEKIFHEPAKVDACNGVVRKLEPDGTSMTMTPEAAATTAAEMLEAAARAKGNRDVAAEREARKRKQTV